MSPGKFKVDDGFAQRTASVLIAAVVATTSGAAFTLAFSLLNPPKKLLTAGDAQSKTIELTGILTQREVALEAQVAAITKANPSSMDGVALAALREQVRQDHETVLNLQRVIQADPQKSLELPMIRRDMDEQRRVTAQALADLRLDADRVYDLAKWLFGALAVGIITLVITNFLRKPN